MLSVEDDDEEEEKVKAIRLSLMAYQSRQDKHHYQEYSELCQKI